jgi:hypothetical protein
MRADQASITASYTKDDGTIVDLGIWETWSGGEVDSTEVKYKPGAMKPAISLGGSKSTNSITIGRTYTLERDHLLRPVLEEGVGSLSLTVSYQPLSRNASVPTDAPAIVKTGILKQYTPPELDSDSEDPQKVSLEISVDG